MSDKINHLQRDSEWSARIANPHSTVTHSNRDGVPTTVISVPDGADGVCDFCSTSEPNLRMYPCADFEVAELTPHGTVFNRMRGAWAACGACAADIEADAWPELQKRSLRLLRAKVPDIDEGAFMAYAILLHKNFRTHRL